MTRLPRVRPFRSISTAVGLTAAILFLTPGPAASQTSADPAPDDVPIDLAHDWSDEVPAHLAVVEGEAWLTRDDLNEAAAQNTPLLAGDRLRTGAGRLEIVFADGSSLAFDEQTDAELVSDTLLRLDRGRIRLALSRGAGSVGYRIDAAGTTTTMRAAGDYRVAIVSGNSDPDVQLLVLQGMAELGSSGERTLVRAGYEAMASARTTPSLPYAVTVASWDPFDRWTDARRDERVGLHANTYLPDELSHYGGVLDAGGDWQYEPAHSTYVWYPRVADDWQPYSSGRWIFVGTYGWVWTGVDRWSWPTHHYGRWGISGRRYYWIPDRRWAPAWVSWASAPGYVGWCPLGFDNRPLISVHISLSRSWFGWTHVPDRYFSSRVVVARRGRYVPPRGALFSTGYRAPFRPQGVAFADHRGLRGPVRQVRSSTAVPRNPQIRMVDPRRGVESVGSRTPSSRTMPGRASIPERRPAVDVGSRRPAVQSASPTRAAAVPRRTPGAVRSDTTRQPAQVERSQPMRSRTIAPAPDQAPPAAARRRVAPAAGGAHWDVNRPQAPARVIAPRAETPASPRARPEGRRAPVVRPAAPPRTDDAPRARSSPARVDRPAPSRVDRPAPSRAPRAESPRPSREQPSSSPRGSGEGSGRARARGR